MVTTFFHKASELKPVYFLPDDETDKESKQEIIVKSEPEQNLNEHPKENEDEENK